MSEPEARRDPPWTRERLEGHFRLAAFLVLSLVGAFATFRAYVALEGAILTWLRPQWIPLAQAGFSLAVLAVVVWLLRAWVIGSARPRQP